MTDPETKFSQSIGWTLGERTGRYALVIDHGKVTYAEKEEKGSDVSVCKTFPAVHGYPVTPVTSPGGPLAARCSSW